MSTDRLAAIVADVRERRAALPGAPGLAQLRAELEADAGRARRFREALRGDSLTYIAECKRRSPSAGALSDEVDLAPRLRAYEEGGASAASILTEEAHFGGSLEDLRAAPEVTLPRLRKDFLLTPEDVLTSQLAGADAILLIARCLEGELLGELRALAGEVGLAVLVEVHEEDELERAIACTPDAVGVNARDLTTFELDLGRVVELLPRVPAGVIRVAESGITGPPDLLRVRDAGADAALVGSALMAQGSPATTLAAWREALDGR